jgi:hypothetical protein
MMSTTVWATITLSVAMMLMTGCGRRCGGGGDACRTTQDCCESEGLACNVAICGYTSGAIDMATIQAGPCAKPNGLIQFTDTRTKLVSGNASSAFCPPSISDSLTFQGGVVFTGTAPFGPTGQPFINTTTYSNMNCSIAAEQKSTGCVSGICRSIDLQYTLHTSPAGTVIDGTLIIAEGSPAAPNDVCAAEYTVQ